MKVAVFDAHNDSLTHRDDLDELVQRRSEGHWDLVRFAEGGGRWQIAAIFTPPKFVGIEALAYALHHLERAWEWAQRQRDKVRLILQRRDLNDDGRIGILLSLEGASPLMGRVEFLRLFFRLGIRCLTLTWNHRNEHRHFTLVGRRFTADGTGGVPSPLLSPRHPLLDADLEPPQRIGGWRRGWRGSGWVDRSGQNNRR